MDEPGNDTGKWLLQMGCHAGTLMSRDGGTSEHETEQEARERFDKAVRVWALIGFKVWYAYLVPPGALQKDAITLHPGTSYV